MPNLVASLKQQLKTDRQLAIETFQADGKTDQLLTQLRRNVDAALTKAWDESGMRATLHWWRSAAMGVANCFRTPMSTC